MIYALLHTPTEGIGLIKDYIKAKELKYKEIKLYENQQLPKNVGNIDAVFVMGGYMNVYEEEKYPFLVQENTFIKKLIKLKDLENTQKVNLQVNGTILTKQNI